MPTKEKRKLRENYYYYGNAQQKTEVPLNYVRVAHQFEYLSIITTVHLLFICFAFILLFPSRITIYSSSTQDIVLWL